MAGGFSPTAEVPRLEWPVSLDFSLRDWKLQSRGYKTFQTIPVFRTPRCLPRQAARGAEPTEGGSCDFDGAEASPFRQLPDIL